MERLLSSDRDFAKFLASRDPAKVAAERPNPPITPEEAVALWPTPPVVRRTQALIDAYATRNTQTAPK